MSKKMSKDDFYGEAAKPLQYTNALPGSEAKIQVMIARRAARQELWHNKDARIRVDIDNEIKRRIPIFKKKHPELEKPDLRKLAIEEINAERLATLALMVDANWEKLDV